MSALNLVLDGGKSLVRLRNGCGRWRICCLHRYIGACPGRPTWSMPRPWREETDMDDATRIRSLIERWAKAVHAGDLDAFSPTMPTTS